MIQIKHEIRRIRLETPPIGGKGWVLEEKGIFILEEGPGTLRTIACTHAGSGSLIAVDGIPDADGRFKGDDIQEFEEIDGKRIRTDDFDIRNGRPLFRANPAMMGSWMQDAGFLHGLTIIAGGGHEATPAVATIVWMPYKKRA